MTPWRTFTRSARPLKSWSACAIASPAGRAAVVSPVAVAPLRQEIAKLVKAIRSNKTAIFWVFSVNLAIAFMVLYGRFIHGPFAFHFTGRIRYIGALALQIDGGGQGGSGGILRSRRNSGQHEPGAYAGVLCSQSTHLVAQFH